MQKGLLVQYSGCTLPRSSCCGDGSVEAGMAQPCGPADSLLSRALCLWLVSLFSKLHCLYEPHNRSCELGSSGAPQREGVFQPHSLRLLFRREPFLILSCLVKHAMAWSNLSGHYQSFALLPSSGMTSSLLRDGSLPDLHPRKKSTLQKCPATEDFLLLESPREMTVGTYPFLVSIHTPSKNEDTCFLQVPSPLSPNPGPPYLTGVPGETITALYLLAAKTLESIGEGEGRGKGRSRTADLRNPPLLSPAQQTCFPASFPPCGLDPPCLGDCSIRELLTPIKTGRAREEEMG